MRFIDVGLAFLVAFQPGVWIRLCTYDWVTWCVWDWSSIPADKAQRNRDSFICITFALPSRHEKTFTSICHIFLPCVFGPPPHPHGIPELFFRQRSSDAMRLS
jgi:hypothetical protein